MTAPTFRTTAEIAGILRGDTNRVRQLIRRGELRAITKYPGRKRPTYLVSDEALARYIAERATNSA